MLGNCDFDYTLVTKWHENNKMRVEMNEDNFILEPSWSSFLNDELQKTYCKSLLEFIKVERESGKKIYPCQSELFNAFNLTPLEKVKVVILGQDPYHGEGQAHGLSFSVKAEVRLPPSLRNIYKELNADVGCEISASGDLSEWAKQGVLLLNSVLSVEQGVAASHKNKGWERFTDQVINVINQRCDNVVFMLWGAYAQKKGQIIDQAKHLVLESVHPSPLSAHRGFFGCKHFSKANTYLESTKQGVINWQINDGKQTC